MWQRARSASKNGFDKAWGWADKLGTPVNNLSNKLGSEAFWPTTMDKECDKAARILRSFCKDGFQALEDDETHEDVNAQGERVVGVPRKNHTKILKRIPVEVIRNAKGLAIFTTMRTGLWVSGAGGSGVLMARLADGSWSCPSGIMLHTAGVGFLVGVDIYDCVMVLNTTEAVAAFSKIRCTVGGELSAVAGPLGVGGVLESEVHARQAPIFTYLKSRGFYAGVQLDGTIIIERTDENERFYGRRIPVADILAGRVSLAPRDTQKLLQTVKMAQGDTDVDISMLSVESAPSDIDIASGQVFGVPAREDPDPYGVLALEEQGLLIRDAGTQQAASHENFQFMPSPTSPLFGAFQPGQSWGKVGSGVDSTRSSWQTSRSDKSLASPKTSSTTLVEQQENGSRPNSATFAAKMAGIPEVDSIDQKLKQPSPLREDAPKLPQSPRSDIRQPKESGVITPANAESNTKPKRSKPPALPARPSTAASRILQEQLALAGQLRELISPTPESSLPNTPTTKSGAFEKEFEKDTKEKGTTPEPAPKAIEDSVVLPVSDKVVLPATIEITKNHIEDAAEKAAEEGAKDQPEFVDCVETNAVTDMDVTAKEEQPVSPAKSSPETDETVEAEKSGDADDEDSEWSSDDEDVVFHDVVTASAPRIAAASPQLVSRPRIVNVTMPTTPALPSRNPNRVRQLSSEDIVAGRTASFTSQDELPMLEEMKSRSRASSVYSAKDEVLSSAKGSDSLASVSSADNTEGLGFKSLEFASPSVVLAGKQTA